MNVNLRLRESSLLNTFVRGITFLKTKLPVNDD